LIYVESFKFLKNNEDIGLAALFERI